MARCTEWWELSNGLYGAKLKKSVAQETALTKLAAYEDRAGEPRDVDALAAENKQLRKRCAAAEEDLNAAEPCFTCKHFNRNGGKCSGGGRCRLDGIKILRTDEPNTFSVEVPDDGRDRYEWRGPTNRRDVDVCDDNLSKIEHYPTGDELRELKQHFEERR